MDPFSYLSVLLSLIIGLAITQILHGFRGMLLGRSRVRMYWPTLAWSILLLIMFVQSWWAMFGLRGVEDWTFFGFCVVLLQTVLEFMLAALVLPDFDGETVDLRAHYYAQARWFFGLFVVLLLVSLSKDLVFTGHLSAPANVAFHVCFMTTSLVAMWLRREWYHKAILIFAAVSFVVYVLLLFSRLQVAGA